jgi:site-specific DNA recombinase
MELFGIAVRRSKPEELRPGEVEPSTDQQLDRCRTYAAQRGLVVSDAHIYRESGVSAYRTRVRPVMDQLIADLESGAINGVICWMFRRMVRDRRYRARLLDLSDDDRCRIISVSEHLDSRDNSFVFDLLGAMSRQESWNTSMDSKRGKRTRAENGLPPSGPRCYGFDRTGLAHVPEEAALLQEAGRRFLAGQGLSTITKDWNRRGERLPGGELWSPTPLRNKLLAPRVGGVASLNGELLEHVEVKWEPIIPSDEWHQIRRILKERKGRGVGGGRPARFLLTGFLHCGECAHQPRLHGRSFSDKNHGNRYLCQPAAGGCYLSVSAPELDRYMSGVALNLLDDDKVVRALLKASTDPARVQQLQDEQVHLYHRQTVELSKMAANPAIPPSVIEQAATDIAKRLGEIDAELRRLQPKRPWIRVGDTATGTWLAGDLQTRRGLLSTVIAKVVVRGAKPGVGRFNAERVEVIPVEPLLSDQTVAAIVAKVLRHRS